MITNQMIFLYLSAVNLLAFSLFGIDKWKAVHHKWRIQEAALLGCSFAGGALGRFLPCICSGIRRTNRVFG